MLRKTASYERGTNCNVLIIHHAGCRSLKIQPSNCPPKQKERKMRRSRNTQKIIAGVVAVMFCYLSVIVAPVQATIVGTNDIIAVQENDMAREKVKLFLQREDVVMHLESMGVDAKEAQARVDTMTPEEINLMANKIDELPAGGDAIGVLLAVAVVLFLVLVITDMLGLTDVFPFINKR